MNAIWNSFLTLSMATLLAACSPLSSSSPATPAADGHHSRNALDWAGIYEGIVPCADCPGIAHRLTLNQDGSYTLITRYLERSPTPQEARGRFTWDETGNRIQLDQAGFGGLRFQVGENRLWMLNPEGQRITGPLADHYLLNKRH